MIFGDWLVQALAPALLFFFLVWRTLNKRSGHGVAIGRWWYVFGFFATAILAVTFRYVLVFLFDAHQIFRPSVNWNIIISVVLPVCSAVLISLMLLCVPASRSDTVGVSPGARKSEWAQFFMIFIVLCGFVVSVLVVTDVRMGQGNQGRVNRQPNSSEENSVRPNYDGQDGALSKPSSASSTPDILNRQINQQSQHITAQAPVQPEQLSRDDQFSKTIIDLERRYKIYDPKSQMYSQEAVDQTVELMNKFISGGDTPVLALLKAGDRLGPYYSQKIYDEMLSLQRREAQVDISSPQPPKKTELKSAKGVFPLPPAEVTECEFKAVMTDEEIARCRGDN